MRSVNDTRKQRHVANFRCLCPYANSAGNELQKRKVNCPRRMRRSGGVEDAFINDTRKQRHIANFRCLCPSAYSAGNNCKKGKAFPAEEAEERRQHDENVLTRKASRKDCKGARHAEQVVKLSYVLSVFSAPLFPPRETNAY